MSPKNDEVVLIKRRKVVRSDHKQKGNWALLSPSFLAHFVLHLVNLSRTNSAKTLVKLGPDKNFIGFWPSEGS